MVPLDGKSDTNGGTNGSRQTSRRTFIAGTVALGTGLAGCGGDSGSTPTATESPSPTDTPSATPTPTTTPTEAGPLVVEDFEHGDLESNYDNEIGSWLLVGEPTFGGSNALKSPSGGWDAAGSIIRSDPPNSPRAGDVFKYRLRFPGGQDEVWSGFNFGADPETAIVEGGRNNLYEVVIDTRACCTGNDPGDLQLTVATENQGEGGIAKYRSALEQEPPRDEWLEVVVDWGAEGEITLTLQQTDGTVIGENTTPGRKEFSTGSIGFNHGPPLVLYDSIEIIERRA